MCLLECIRNVFVLLRELSFTEKTLNRNKFFRLVYRNIIVIHHRCNIVIFTFNKIIDLRYRRDSFDSLVSVVNFLLWRSVNNYTLVPYIVYHIFKLWDFCYLRFPGNIPQGNIPRVFMSQMLQSAIVTITNTGDLTSVFTFFKSQFKLFRARGLSALRRVREKLVISASLLFIRCRTYLPI